MNYGQERVVCPRCHANNMPGQPNCFACGTPLTAASRPPTPQPAPQQPSAPAQQPSGDTKSQAGCGALTGGLLGCSFGIWMIIGGVLLSLTGIGAIIGVPLIIAGIALPFLAPLIGAATISGKCPHCGASVIATAQEIGNGGMDCTACARRILIRDKRFMSP